jgi:hypothetical protein
VDFEDPRESFLLKGTFVRSESVEGRKELIALAIQFDETAIPMGYKMRINDFLSTVRLDVRPEGETAGAAPNKSAYRAPKPAIQPAAEKQPAPEATPHADQSAPDQSAPDQKEDFVLSNLDALEQNK